MKRYLITGGAGVIGLEIVPKLITRGNTVWVGDLKPRPESFDKQVHYRQGDLNSLSVSEVKAFSPDVIIHLAATVERSAESARFCAENFYPNVSLSHNIMSVAQQIDSLKRVVFASSHLAYHPELYQYETLPDHPVSLKESDSILPGNLTGIAKLAYELELRFLSEQSETSFSIACTRIFRVYGKNSRNVISRWVRLLLAGKPIDVYNSEGMFDYLYARDSAEGLIRVAENENVSGIINLGTGRARKVSDIVCILRDHFPDMAMVEHSVIPPIEFAQADMTLWRSQMDWLPEYALEHAIPEIIDYERRNLNANQNDSEPAKSILITSASGKVPLVRAVMTALDKLGSQDAACWVGDNDPDALTRYYADNFWRLARQSATKLDDFIRGCNERGIGVLIPTRDGELEFWAQHKQLLSEAGIQVIVSPLDSVRRCNDKLAFSEYGLANGFSFIPAALTPDELHDTDCENRRYTVKERYGAGSHSIGLNLAYKQAIAHGEGLSYPIYQPYIAGREISVDGWMNATGQPKGLVMRWRDLIRNGESQVTTTFREPRLEKAFFQILEALDLRGPAVIQAILDSDGGFHIIECNTRFGGASTLSIAAGLDSIFWSLLEVQKVNLDDVPYLRVDGELRQVRAPCDKIIHDPDI